MGANSSNKPVENPSRAAAHKRKAAQPAADSPSKKPYKKQPHTSEEGPENRTSVTKGVDTKAVVKVLAKQQQKTRKEKRVEIRAKKAFHKPEYVNTQEAVKTWEVLRRHDTTAKQRPELVTKILQLVKGRMADLAASPTAARVIQACAKHGTAAQRAQLLEELKPRLLELAKNPYGHFVVCKLINVATKDQLAGVLKLLKGKVPALLRHPSGAAVVDDAYTNANAAQRNAMVAEFYGKEYSLFQDEVPAVLGELLKGLPPPKQRALLQNLAIHVIAITEKGLVDSALSHRLIAEYLEHAPASGVEGTVETLCGPNLLRIVHTRPGAAAACMALAYGTAKDRKKAVKAMKGHVVTMAKDEWAHVVLMTALLCIDDTAVLKKVVVSELQGGIEELCGDVHARRIFLQLLAPDSKRYVPALALGMMHPPTKMRSQLPAAATEQEEGALDRQAPAETQEPLALGSSKKDPLLRRKEILGAAKGSLAEQLVKQAAATATADLRSKTGGDLVVEVARGGVDGVLLGGDNSLEAVHNAIVEDAAKSVPESSSSGRGETEHLFNSWFSSRCMRRLIQLSNEDGAGGDGARLFVAKLWENSLQGRCKSWVEGHAAKLIAAVVDCGVEAVRSAAVKELEPLLLQPVHEWAAKFNQKRAITQQQS